MSSLPVSDVPVMPDFVSGTHAFRHNLHTALACLARLRVPASRIHIKPVGKQGVPAGVIVKQSPEAGALLDGGIQLDVAGMGFYHDLPVAMWDSGGEAEPGTRELLESLDDPLQKLTHWIYEGASLLRLAPGNLAAAAKWISLFGLVPEEWPRKHWYNLALLLLELPEIAGSEEAVRFALDRVFGLPVSSSAFRSSLAVLKKSSRTQLGEGASRLGIDLIVGDAFYDLAHLRIDIGPVSLERYEEYVDGSGRQLLNRVLALVLPFHMDYELHWIVLDPKQPPRLGIAEQNCRLQVNSYLGAGQRLAEHTL
jgi:type VI secretion system (T6SS) VasB/ImpH family protein